MAAGAGYYDANGVYRYGETDNIGLVSDLLNIGMESVSDSITELSEGILTGWTAYTPTFAGFTLGNGSVAFYYKQIGKTVFVNGNITLGSTSAMPGPFDFSLPTSLRGRQAGLLPAGRTYYYNNAVLYNGSVLFIGGNYVRSIIDTVSGTRIVNNEVSANAPFTWGNGHTYKFTLVYEAA